MDEPKSLFFYGTLRHLPLLAEVLGSDPAGRLRPGRLKGYTTVLVMGTVVPSIIEQAGAVIDGLLIDGISDEERRRLDFYETGYAVRAPFVRVDGPGGAETAAVYRRDPGSWEADGPWTLERWLEEAGARSVIAAREVMAYPVGTSGATLNARRPTAMMRADTKLRAGSEEKPAEVRTDAQASSVEVIGDRQPYTSYFAFAEKDIRFPRFDGTKSETVKREALLAADAVTVLPYDPARDRVLVVEQFRFGAFARGDRQPWSLEPIAGRIDPGETPEETARREAVEEAGLELGTLHHIADYYPSPGALTEYLYTYVGMADLPDAAARLGGLESEAEDIKGHVLARTRMMELIATGEINNGPLILSALWLERERKSLR